MFTSSHPNHIESDEGFSIQVLGGGRLGIIYREGKRAIKVLSDTAIDPYGYIIFKNSISHWDWQDSDSKIDEATRDRIIDNLSRAFLFQGYRIRVDDIEKFRDEFLRKEQRID